MIEAGAARLATRLAFLVAGFGIAAWAPLIPLAKQRLGLDDARLGLLLLCIGAGSIGAMVLTGPLSARLGSRPVMLAGGLGMTVLLPGLAVAEHELTLAAGLLAFGASLGSLDVAMNIHAIEVERRSGLTLMSGFHALYSVGGVMGATAMTLALSAGLGPGAGALVCAAAMGVAMAASRPGMLRQGAGAPGPLFVRPRGTVLALAGLAVITFLAEGAMLDWGALLVTDLGLVGETQSGFGYMLFAVAMMAGRLAGDRVTGRFGDRRVFVWGGVIMIVGFVLLLAVPFALVALPGFVLIGLGLANLVPIVFRASGTQDVMPPALAIGAITTCGYAGILAGPAGIGALAHAIGLHGAFWLLAGLVCLLPLGAGQIGRSD